MATYQATFWPLMMGIVAARGSQRHCRMPSRTRLRGNRRVEGPRGAVSTDTRRAPDELVKGLDRPRPLWSGKSRPRRRGRLRLQSRDDAPRWRPKFKTALAFPSRGSFAPAASNQISDGSITGHTFRRTPFGRSLRGRRKKRAIVGFTLSFSFHVHPPQECQASRGDEEGPESRLNDSGSLDSGLGAFSR